MFSRNQKRYFQSVCAVLAAIALTSCAGPGWLAKSRGIFFEQQADAYYSRQDSLDQEAKTSYKQAIDQFDAAAKFLPKDAACHYHRGWCRRRLGEKNEALKDFTEAVALAPGDVYGWTQRAELFAEMGVYDKALEDFEQALRLSPKDNGELLVGKANCEKMLGNWKQASTDYAAAIAEDPHPYYYCVRAGAEREHGDIKAMYADYNHALNLEPHRADTYLSRGYSEFILGRYDESTTDLKKFLHLTHYVHPHAPYAVIFATYCARLNHNENTEDNKTAADTLLHEGMENFGLDVAEDDKEAQPGSRWPTPAIQFLNGDISEQTLMKCAGSDLDHLTEAHCYVGLNELINKKEKSAMEEFNWVVGHGNKNYVEYEIAKSILKSFKKLGDQ